MAENIQFILMWLGATATVYLIRRQYIKFRWQLVIDASKSIQTGDYQRAIELAEAASRRYPKDWQPQVMAAAAHIQLHDPGQALECCNRALQLAPKPNNSLYLNLAYARAGVSDLDGALDAANRVLEWKHTYDALLARAYVYLLQYRYEQALADCNEAIGMKPAQRHAYFQRVGVHFRLNNIEAARADLNTIMERLEENPSTKAVASALAFQAVLHSIEGKLDQAVEESSRAVELHASDSSFLSRAYFLTLTKALDKAAIDLDCADELAKGDRARAYVASNRARIAIINRDSEKALALSDRALSLMQHPSLLCTRAAAYLLSNQIEKAEQDLKLAEDLDPLFAEVYWWKGRLLEIKGDAEAAEANKQKALQWHYRPYY